MIVVVFKVSCRAEKLAEAVRAFERVIAPSRALEGVVSFDVAQDLSDPASLVATEVFADRAALDRQESLPEVAAVMGSLPEILAGDPEATIFEVASSAPYE